MPYYSPGIAKIYHKAVHANKFKIMDLCQVCVSCFQLFAPHCEKIHYENLNDFVIDYLLQPQKDLIDDIEAQLSKHDSSDRFDVIFSWDLFNFLPLKVVGSLLTHVGEYCKPNALVHSIRYWGKLIPSRPAKFVLNDPQTFNFFLNDLTTRKIRSYSSSEFAAKNPHFFLHSSHIIETSTSGRMTEDILQYAPANAKPHKDLLSQDKPDRKKLSPRGDTTNMSLPTQIEDHPQYTSLILQDIFKDPSCQGKRILDLGHQTPITSATLQQKFYEVYSENLLTSLKQQTAQQAVLGTNAHAPTTTLGLALNFGRLAFDVIIFWDILNFCDDSQISVILQLLSKYCHLGSRLIILSYTGSNLPVAPQKFYLTNKGKLHIPNTERMPRQRDMLSSGKLITLADFLTIKSSQVLMGTQKSGIAELLFEFTCSPTDRKAYQLD